MKKMIKFCGLVCALSLVVGCAAQRHGWTQSDFNGYVVPVASRPGGLRLQIERDYDATIEEYVSGRGEPDYIYVVDHKNVKLVYMDSKQVAVFRRGFGQVDSKVSIEEGLSADVAARLRQLEELDPRGL